MAISVYVSSWPWVYISFFFFFVCVPIENKSPLQNCFCPPPLRDRAGHLTPATYDEGKQVHSHMCAYTRPMSYQVRIGRVGELIKHTRHVGFINPLQRFSLKQNQRHTIVKRKKKPIHNHRSNGQYQVRRQKVQSTHHHRQQRILDARLQLAYVERCARLASSPGSHRSLVRSYLGSQLRTRAQHMHCSPPETK